MAEEQNQQCTWPSLITTCSYQAADAGFNVNWYCSDVDKTHGDSRFLLQTPTYKWPQSRRENLIKLIFFTVSTCTQDGRVRGKGSADTCNHSADLPSMHTITATAMLPTHYCLYYGGVCSTGLLVNRLSYWSCTRGMIHNKIHPISPSCPRPSISWGLG